MNKIKDLKIYKKLLSLLSAFTIMLTPISGLTEEEKEDSKTNEVKVEEMIEEETNDITVEEFVEKTQVLRKKYLPLAVDYLYDAGAIERLYFISNVEKFRKITDELMNKEIIHKDIEPLFENFYSVRIVPYIFDSFIKDKSLEVDFSDFILDEKESLIVSKICNLNIELIRECRISKKLNIATLREFLELCEQDNYSLGTKCFICEVLFSFQSQVEPYIYVYAKKSEVKKFINLDKSSGNYYILNDGVTLSRDTDNVVELAIYAHEFAINYANELVDVIFEYDSEYQAERQNNK